ncbi:MAG: ATP-dependent DNA helicase [Burkholderiales bacterium]|nr:ATP-dependent DNA helicase [Burkholderiales bacterium]
MTEAHPAPDARLAAIFAADGPLARAVAGFKVRPQQVEMASAVAAAIRDRAVLVAEAGTGTGKTFAYLVPALLSGGKVIVSTGTKTLQDQLFRRDLPLVRDALRVPATVALLKGRANYVCPYHLERNAAEARFASREEARRLARIAAFARASATGDRSELADVPEDAAAWGAATSTRENCLGQQCPRLRECFVMKARRDALAADVVVVNHHLFFADAVLRDEGMAELLPACNTVILDEAHQLPETASLFFGETVSSGQVLDLCRDTAAELHVAARDVREADALVRGAEIAARDLRLAVPGRDARLAATALEREPRFGAAVAALDGSVASLARALAALAERSEGLANCARRAADLGARLTRWRAGEEAGLVRWVETYTQAVALHATPLSIAEIFRRELAAGPRAWIFTSATLAVAGDFGLYAGEMGLEDARTACWESPFDYAANALLCVPRGLPEPNSAEHTDAVVDAALTAIRASGGRAFLLFTTLRAMRRAHERLAARLAGDGLGYPLLVQGEGSRSALLERFRALGNAVLVASASFWEGVDVRGEALSLVVIDKLPFAPPDDPVLAARLEAMAKRGANPFLAYQLPQAAIALKQGAGRLIRDECDRGVLLICDPRLVSRPYGRRILASLPPMRRTRELADVVAFFGHAAAAGRMPRTATTEEGR